MTEEWKPVVGYEGLYEVSSKGQVRSLDRLDAAGRRCVGRVLKPNTGINGYMKVTLYNGASKTHNVHRLVAEAFIGPCPDNQEVRHGPYGKTCNEVSNLSYGTHSENQLDQRRDGTQPDRRGEKHPMAKLTESDVSDIRLSASLRCNQKRIAAAHGVSIPTVSMIVTRKTWQHVIGA